VIRRDVRYDDRKVVLLFEPKTGQIWLRLLAPLEGRPTFATPAIPVTFKDLQRFEKECLHIHNREICPFPPSLDAKPIRIYADRPQHVIVKLRDRKFAEGPLDVMEFAVRSIITHWWKWERTRAQ
jgi:hypothetical protein